MTWIYLFDRVPPEIHVAKVATQPHPVLHPVNSYHRLSHYHQMLINQHSTILCCKMETNKLAFILEQRKLHIAKTDLQAAF